MTRILFINPNTRYLGTLLTVYPPLGILYLSSTLMKAGYEVKVIDADVDNLDLPDIRCAISKYTPDFVGITMNTLQSKAAFETAHYIKKHGDIKVIAGGPHPSALKAEILRRCKSIDVVVYGEGETTFGELIKAIEDERSLDTVEGICFRNDHEIKTNEPRDQIADLDRLPRPALDLVAPIRKYPGPYPVGARPSMHVMASRGCPFNCTFCSNPVWERKIRLRSPESVLSEVEWLQESFDVKEIFFQDDTFNVNRHWFESICNGIIDRRLNEKIIFKAPFRANEKLVDLELLKLAKRAGFWMIFYGVESGNQNILDSIKKDLSLEEIERAFKLTRKAGIKTFASFMIGNLGESSGTIQDTVNFAKRIDPNYYGFALAMPYPGSDLYSIAKESGYLKADFEDYTLDRYVLDTGKFSPAEVERLATNAHKSLVKYRTSRLYRLRKVLSGDSSSYETQYPGYFRAYLPALKPPDREILDKELIMGKNDLDVLGCGWYAVENWPPCVRWSGKKATAYLKRSNDLTHLSISMYSFHAGKRIWISVNNRKEVYNLNSGWNVVRVPLTDLRDDFYLKVDIEVDKTWVPDKIIGNGDMRNLGVAVERMHVD